MSRRFPDDGYFALVEGGIYEARHVADGFVVTVRDRSHYVGWSPRGELLRMWTGAVGHLGLRPRGVDEIVAVGHRGRYREYPVIRAGGVADGLVEIVVDVHPGLPALPMLDADRTVVPVGEFVEVVETVERVRGWRSPGGPLSRGPAHESRTVRFVRSGYHARIGTRWFKASVRDDVITVRVLDERLYASWFPEGEMQRSWHPGQGEILLAPDAVDEYVRVTQRGRYRGLPVYRIGGTMHGDVCVTPQDPHPEAGAGLGFSGHPRFGRDRMIPAAEFDDIVEEVDVHYRRPEGWLR